MGYNDGLNALTGLENIDSINGSLYIRNNTSLANFCSMSTFLNNGGLSGSYTVSGNAYNPSLQDINSGNCN